MKIELSKNIAEFRRRLCNKYPCDVYVYEKEINGSKVVVVGAIRVDKIKQGIGTKVMGEVCKYADSRGAVVALTPANDLGTPLYVLRKFYGSFGFKKNRRSDISESMIRLPKGSK